MKIPVLLLVVFALTNYSCKKENCIESRTAYVMSVNAPEFGAINEDINIEVQYAVSNTSGQFEKFVVTNSNNYQNIDVIASYSGCDNLAVAPIRTSNYIFNTPTPGTYYFNFNAGDDSYVQDTIIVN